MGTEEPSAAEFETLETSGREVAGNQESATVRDVFVGDRTARIVLAFDWTAETEIVEFDLDSERDVLELKSLARSRGYAFEQLPYLEGEQITAVYLDGQWLPAETVPDVDANVLTDATPDTPAAGPITRTYDALLDRVEEVTSKDVILAAIALKKILIAAALVYLLLTI